MCRAPASLPCALPYFSKRLLCLAQRHKARDRAELLMSLKPPEHIGIELQERKIVYTETGTYTLAPSETIRRVQGMLDTIGSEPHGPEGTSKRKEDPYCR